MTQTIRISLPDDGGTHEVHVVVGAMNYYLQPGDSMESYVYKGQEIRITEVEAGTKAQKANEAAVRAESIAREQDKPEQAAPVSGNESTSTVSMGGDEPPEDLPLAGTDERAADPVEPAAEKPATKKR